jgi:hypothetical protein
VLTALESEYVNPTVIKCDFKGSNQPTISWWTDKKIDPSQDEFAAFSFTPGNWVDKSMSDQLNIDLNKLKDTTSVTCKVAFSGGLNDPLQTITKIHKRGLFVVMKSRAFILYSRTKRIIRSEIDHKHGG